MSTELVKIEPQDLAQGGVGVDFGSKLFRSKPMTLAINQSNTQVEGAVPGKFRITETGDQFERLSVVLLTMPEEGRNWYIGEPGTLHKKPENLMCFSRDMIKPDTRSKMPQAMFCKGCPKAEWDKSVTPNKPAPCDPQYYAIFIDTVTQMPLRMFINGASRVSFEKDTSILANKFRLLKSKGVKANLFDMKFDIFLERGKNKTFKNYVLRIDPKSPELIQSEEQRKEFGELYMNYVNADKSDEVNVAMEEAISQEDTAVDEAVSGEYVNEQGEIKI